MPAKILVVEDDPDFRELLQVILFDEGYSVIVAEDGAAGLRLVESDQPDLILTDIQMPGTDGIYLIKHLREHPQWSHIPVIALSAQGSGNLSEAVRAGANGGMKKPAQLASILQLIDRLLASLPSVCLPVCAGLVTCML